MGYGCSSEEKLHLREIRIKRSDVKDKVEINVTLMIGWHHRLNGHEFE